MERQKTLNLLVISQVSCIRENAALYNFWTFVCDSINLNSKNPIFQHLKDCICIIYDGFNWKLARFVLRFRKSFF